MSLFRVISHLFRFNRTNWKAVTLCLLAAFVFWLFSALNKNHTTNISFPVHFEFDSDRYVPISMPQHVRLNVSGNGWDLLRKSLGLRLPVLNIPLERPIEVKKIPEGTLISLVSSQLGSVQINYVIGDTIDLKIDLKDSHKFRLVADLSSISYKKGFGRISPVVILPDSVEIEGPKSTLHNFPDTIILMLPENKVNGDFREEVEVVVPDAEIIKRNPPVVEVRFEVGEVEEVIWKLKLELLNKPARLMIEGAHDSVTCHLIVPRNQGRNILSQAHVARATIDLSELQKGKSVVVPKAEGLSPIVQILRIDSVYLNLF